MSDKKTTNAKNVLSDAQLVKNCVNGKMDSQELLYRRFSSHVWHLFKICKNRMEAEDIMQKVL